MRKAISPVISVILLIVMTIGAAALAFFWITGVQSNIQETVGGNVEGSAGRDCSRLNLISIRGDGAIVQNVGCDTIGSVNFFINGVLTSYDLEQPLAPGQAATISYASQDAGEDLRVTVVLSNGATSSLFSPADENVEDSGFGLFIDVTYPFTDDADGSDPADWIVWDSEGVVQVVSSIGSRNKVVEFSTTASGAVGMYNSFYDPLPVPSPYTVAVWIYASQTDKAFYIFLENDQLRPALVYQIADLTFNNDGNIFVQGNNLMAYTADTWYYIEFVESGTQYYVYINSAEYGPYDKSSSYDLTCVEFYTETQTSSSFYVDDIDYSWD